MTARQGGLEPKPVVLEPYPDADYISGCSLVRVDIHKPEEILSCLIKIIEVEGPVLCLHLYERYLEGTDESLTRSRKKKLNVAVHRGTQNGRLVKSDEHHKVGQINSIVRLKGTPPVRLRQRGHRALGQIPPSEVGQLMKVIAQEHGVVGGDRESLFELVISYYELPSADQHDRSLLVQAYNAYGPSAKGASERRPRKRKPRPGKRLGRSSYRTRRRRRSPQEDRFDHDIRDTAGKPSPHRY